MGFSKGIPKPNAVQPCASGVALLTWPTAGGECVPTIIAASNENDAMRIAFASLLAVLVLLGCSQVKTRAVLPNGALVFKGVTYGLPKKDIAITLTITDSVPTIAVMPTDAYADPDAPRFYSTHARNELGTNALKIEVSANGLLTSAEGKYTETLSTTLSEMAGTKIQTFPGPAIITTQCPKNSVTKAVIAIRPGQDAKKTSLPVAGGKSCNFYVTVTYLGKSQAADPLQPIQKKVYYGFFYRQNQPYRVDVEFGSQSQTSYVALPGPTTYFAPINRGVLASNEAKLSFDNGSLTSYYQTTDSEILGLFKLPANIVRAYFGAIGAMFDSRKSTLEKESNYITQVQALQLTQLRAELCAAALAAKDEAAIAAKCPK